GFQTSHVLAGESNSDDPTPQPTPVVGESGSTEGSTQISMPHSNNGQKPSAQPNAGVYSPNGGSSATLTSRLAWNIQGWGADFTGSSIITKTAGTMSAKAWTTLIYDNTVVATTNSSPCYTTSSCTSSVFKNLYYGGHTVSNFAEAVVTWTDGTNTPVS